MKNRHRIRIKSTKPQKVDFTTALKHIAEQYMNSEHYLLPLILKNNVSSTEAIVLIATHANITITGKNSMSEQDIIGACNLLIMLWKQGLFTPSPNYPYTLAQTLEAGEGEP